MKNQYPDLVFNLSENKLNHKAMGVVMFPTLLLNRVLTSKPAFDHWNAKCIKQVVKSTNSEFELLKCNYKEQLVSLGTESPLQKNKHAKQKSKLDPAVCFSSMRVKCKLYHFYLCFKDKNVSENVQLKHPIQGQMSISTVIRGEKSKRCPDFIFWPILILMNHKMGGREPGPVLAQMGG